MIGSEKEEPILTLVIQRISLRGNLRNALVLQLTGYFMEYIQGQITRLGIKRLELQQS